MSSPKSVQRLVDRAELVPLTYGKAHLYARVELDRFLAEQLDQERALRRLKP